MAGPIGRPLPRRTTTPSSSKTASLCSTRPAPTERCWSGRRWAAYGRCCSHPAIPNASCDRRTVVRAREPDIAGFVDRDGVKVAYEVFGAEHDRTICFAPSNPILHARGAKTYAPWLSRHYRVITIDPRGNGRSDRPADPRAYGASIAADDTLAVLDELSVERAVLHGTSWAALPVLFSYLKAPERVAGLVLMGPLLPVGEPYD